MIMTSASLKTTIEAAWEARAEQLRRRVKIATHLWPMPARTPLNAVIHGKVQRPGFTVEKVYFESSPNQSTARDRSCVPVRYRYAQLSYPA